MLLEFHTTGWEKGAGYSGEDPTTSPSYKRRSVVNKASHADHADRLQTDTAGSDENEGSLALRIAPNSNRIFQVSPLICKEDICRTNHLPVDTATQFSLQGK